MRDKATTPETLARMKLYIKAIIVLSVVDALAICTQYGYHLTNPDAPFPHGGFYVGLSALGIFLSIILIALLLLLIKLITKYRKCVRNMVDSDRKEQVED